MPGKKKSYSCELIRKPKQNYDYITCAEHFYNQLAGSTVPYKLTDHHKRNKVSLLCLDNLTFKTPSESTHESCTPADICLVAAALVLFSADLHLRGISCESDCLDSCRLSQIFCLSLSAAVNMSSRAI